MCSPCSSGFNPSFIPSIKKSPLYRRRQNDLQLKKALEIFDLEVNNVNKELLFSFWRLILKDLLLYIRIHEPIYSKKSLHKYMVFIPILHIEVFIHPV